MDTPRAKVFLEPLRRGTPERLKKLLEPVDIFKIKPTSVTNFENDFTDPYEDITKDYISMRKENQHLSRNEINKIVMDSFTDNYKKAIRDFRVENQLDNKHILEDIKEDLKNICNKPKQNKPITEERRIKREKALHVTVLPKMEWKNKLEINKYPEDYPEAVWRDLAIKCEFTQFRITPIGYNLYSVIKPQSKKPGDVPREQIEVATEKCANWLEKRHKNNPH